PVVGAGRTPGGRGGGERLTWGLLRGGHAFASELRAIPERFPAPWSAGPPAAGAPFAGPGRVAQVAAVSRSVPYPVRAVGDYPGRAARGSPSSVSAATPSGSDIDRPASGRGLRTHRRGGRARPVGQGPGRQARHGRGGGAHDPLHLHLPDR